jgi:hypothetical protein
LKVEDIELEREREGEKDLASKETNLRSRSFEKSALQN